MGLGVPLWLRWTAAVACCIAFAAAAYAGAREDPPGGARPQEVELLPESREGLRPAGPPREEVLERGLLGPGLATTRPSPAVSPRPSAKASARTPSALRSRTATRPPAAPEPERPVTTQVSSLEPLSAFSGWGPYEKNTSNGEKAAGDGRTMSIRGATYPTGLGVHSFSSMKYELAGRYTQFRSVIGIDDETCDKGDAQFLVMGDGVRLYSSPVLSRRSAAVTVSVRTTGVKVLELVVTDADQDGVDVLTCDHADWADARLIR